MGEGVLTNLSYNGCSVLSNRTPVVGTTVRVSILLPDQHKAVSIEAGTVKWVDGQLYGVEFLSLPLDTRLRLNRALRPALIHRLAVRHVSQDQSTNIDHYT